MYLSQIGPGNLKMGKPRPFLILLIRLRLKNFLTFIVGDIDVHFIVVQKFSNAIVVASDDGHVQRAVVRKVAGHRVRPGLQQRGHAWPVAL